MWIGGHYIRENITTTISRPIGTNAADAGITRRAAGTATMPIATACRIATTAGRTIRVIANPFANEARDEWGSTDRSPRILQRHRTIEHRRAGFAVRAIGDEIAVAFEWKRVFGGVSISNGSIAADTTLMDSGFKSSRKFPESRPGCGVLNKIGRKAARWRAVRFWYTANGCCP